MAADKNNHLVELKFNYNAVDFERYEKDVYSSNGWFGRKITAIPAIAILGVVKTIIGLASAILIALPKAVCGNARFLKHLAYTLTREYQGLFGRFVTLFNDKRGQYILFQSRIHKKLYMSARLPDKIHRLASSKYGVTEPQVDITRKAILSNLTHVNGTIGNSGHTPLMLAVEHGYEDVVMDFLNRGAEINEQGDCGKTALSVAIRAQRPTLALKLIEHGADVNLEAGLYFGACKETPLRLAANLGLKEVVKQLLEMGVEVNKTDTRQETALTHAIKKDHPEIAILLLENGAEPNSKVGSLKKTPLMEAAIKGHTEVCDLLLQKGAKINEKNQHGSTALSFALHKGHKEIAMRLINLDADVKYKPTPSRDTLLISAAKQGFKDVVEKLLDKGVTINTKDSNGKNALYYAIANLYPEIALLLLEHGADVKCKNRYTGETPLMVAASSGYMEVVSKLVDKGAILDTKDNDGVTAVSKAIKAGHIEIAEFLIDQGADVNLKYNGSGLTPLIDAAIKREKELVARLIAKGAQVNVVDYAEKTALAHALEWGNEEIAMLLIKNGADLLHTGQFGKHTNYFYAAWKGCKKVVEYMLNNGIDPIEIAENGSNALHFAAQGGHLDIVKFFLENIEGVHIESVGYKNRTALHFAAITGKANVVEYLLKKGANPEIADEVGRTPLDIATMIEHEDVIRLLKKRL